MHDILSPSGLKANALCAGRLRMNEGLPDKQSIYSETGTAAHELLEKLLLGSVSPTVTSYTASNGIDLDENDDIAHVIKTYHYVVNFINSLNDPDVVLLVECKVDPGLYYNGKPTSRGTVDIAIISPLHRVIFTFDYKHGAGVVVEVEDNYQMMVYALGLLNYYLHFDYLDWNIVMGVLQPRAYHHDSPFRFATKTVHDLIHVWKPYFQEVVNLSMSKTGALVAGDEQCRWCKAKATCPELANKSLKETQLIFSSLSKDSSEEIKKNALQEPEQLTDEQLKAVLDNKDLIAGWLDAVKAYVEKRMLAHDPVAGFKMVNGRSSRKWLHDDTETISSLVAMGIPLQELISSKLKSPSQIENGLKRKLKPEVWEKIEALITKTPGKATLVDEYDKRPSAIVSARDVFKPIQKLSFLD